MTDEKKPKPAPRDWHLHIERDVAWMLNPNTTQDDRERYAARIRDMVMRAHTNLLSAKRCLWEHVNGTEMLCIGCGAPCVESAFTSADEALPHRENCDVARLFKEVGIP